jgi:RNA polymerase sigma-70 factor (sigma-E family)
MRGGGRESSNSHQNVLLSRLYQQVTRLHEPRFGAEYDLASGLDRYSIWLREHRDDARPAAAAGADSLAAPGVPDADEELQDRGALPASAAGALDSDAVTPDAFLPSAARRTEWSADLAVIELYTRHYRALVRLAAMLVRDTPTAEEVVQEAFIAMHGGWHRLKDTEKALAYLRQAVVNKSRSVLRHRMVVEKNLQKAPPDMPSAEHAAFALLERSAVVDALRDLPERQREAIVLRYYADLSEAEIAAAMGITRGAVKSHTARGMAALRAALERE